MKNELIELINEELEFSSCNYERFGITEEQKEWFIKGLEQSKHIIENYYDLLKTI